MLSLVARATPSGFWRYASPALALILTLVSGAALFAALGKDPVKGLQVFVIAPLSTKAGLSEVLLKSIPLILCGIGLALCYRADVWNIGAEGQLIVGAICAGAAVLAFDTPAKSMPASAVIVLALSAGALGGALWAGLTALLRDRFNANEILVSLMLVYVAQLLLIYCVSGPLKDPQGYNFPQSKMFSRDYLLAFVWPGTRLHWGIFVAILASLAGAVLALKSFAGFQWQVGGLAPKAARYAGFNARAALWGSLLTCGALAGLAGAFEIMGPVGQLTPSISPGYGFAAIIVAWVARLHPIGVVPAALVLSIFYIGGEYAQSRIGLPSSITGIFQGMLLFFLLACDTFIAYRLRVGATQ